jgi:hypothetical protein
MALSFSPRQQGDGNVAATSSSTPRKVASPPTTAASAATSAAARPSPTGLSAATIGQGFAWTSGTSKADVYLTKVIDPAQGADQYTAPDAGKRFVAAVFKLKGVNGSISDDANSDAAVVGSDGQTYTPDFSSIAGYTNFNNGQFSVSAGETSIGAVVFQVPDGVKVTKIEWTVNPFGGQPAEWIVP